MPAEAVATARPVEGERFQTDRVLTITAGHAVHDTYTAFLPPLLPAFIENLALSNTAAGLLTVFNQLPSITQPFIGHLADRFSLRILVILAPGVTATLMSLLGVAPSYAVLALLLLLVGVSSSALHSIAPVMAGRLSGRNLGRGMGFWMLGGELGRTLGPLVIVFAVQFLGLGGTPWLMAGGWLASALLYFRLRDVPARPPVSPAALTWQGALGTMKPFLVPLVAIIVVRSFMVSALTTYLPVLLTEEGAALTLAGISLSVLEAAGVAGALLGGSLSDRLGRRLVLLISLAATPVLMVAFMAVSGRGAVLSISWTQFPLLLLLGFTALSTTPVVMAVVQESFPDNRALANGVYMALSFLIRSGAVVIVGAVGDAWGMRVAFLVSAAVPLLGIPFLSRFTGRSTA
jgi:FSR family fosmidomycin resistance protein-like MFS transporter